MSLPYNLPENYKIVVAAQTAAANGVTYDTISCKDAHKVWFVVVSVGSSDTDQVLSLVESTDVGDTTTTAVTATFPIWVNTNTGSTTADALVRQTDAASYTIDTGTTGNQMVVIEWDPAKHSSGYDCIKLADSGGNASNKVARRGNHVHRNVYIFSRNSFVCHLNGTGALVQTLHVEAGSFALLCCDEETVNEFFIAVKLIVATPRAISKPSFEHPQVAVKVARFGRNSAT